MSTSAVATAEKAGPVARPLKTLVPLIQKDLALAKEAEKQAGMPYYIAAGEKLNEAKAQLPHGEFMEWAGFHFKLSHTHLNLYMRLAREQSKAPGSTFTSLKAFKRTILPNVDVGEASWHRPVRKALSHIDFAAMRAADLRRAEERELERTLGRKLIDIGYKVLAQKLHPDKQGGSKEGFQRLRNVRTRLLNSV